MYEKCFIIFNMTDYWDQLDYKFQYIVSLQSKMFFTTKLFKCIF